MPELREKLSLFCNVPVKAVIEERNVEASIYELPLMLQREGLDSLVVGMLRLKAPPNPKNIWAGILRRIKAPRYEVTIGVVGKYIELQDAYKSVYESITHAGIANNCKVNIARIDAETLEARGGTAILRRLDGILVPGGFGERGIEGKILAARYARENNLPYLGLCLGMQIATIEFARNVLKLARAQVGDRYVIEEMKKGNFNVGGEQSGHIVLSDFCTTGDGLIAGLQVLAVIAQEGKTASQAAHLFEPLPQVLQNVRFRKGAPLEDARVKSCIEDCRARLNGAGRILVRKSGTEPVIRVMAEGDDEKLIQSVVHDIAAAIEEAAV